MTEPDARDLALIAELTELGRALPPPEPAPDLVDRVLARIAAEPRAAQSAPEPQLIRAPEPGESPGRPAPIPSNSAPAPSRGEATGPRSISLGRLAPRRLRTRIAASITALVAGLAVVPPVRAAVLEWFSIGGVTVRQEPTAPDPTGSGSTGQNGSAVPVDSVADAGALVGIDVAVPGSLGAPTEIVVTRDARVVELTWGSGADAIRLDVFAGSPDYGYLKSVQDVEWTDVAGNSAVWLAEPHTLQWIDRRGGAEAAEPRIAGPTLVWAVPAAAGEVTYRLEGVPTRAEAVALAATARP